MSDYDAPASAAAVYAELGAWRGAVLADEDGADVLQDADPVVGTHPEQRPFDDV